MSSNAIPARREPATVRVAMWCSRHRWPVFALWFIGTIGLFLVSLPGGGIKAEDPNGNPNQAQTESAKAYAAFQSGGTNAPTEDVSIVITHPSLKVTDQAFQAYIARDIADAQGADGRRKRHDGPGIRQRLRPRDRTARGRSRRARPLDRPPRRHDQGRSGDGRPPPRARPAGDRRDRVRRKRVHGPQRQRDADERGHHEPHQQQSRHDVHHDRPDLRDPADDVRGRRGRGRPDRAGADGARRRVRDLRTVQPGGEPGQPVCQPADHPDRAGGLGRLLAVHDHAVPIRATARPRQARRDRDRERAPPVGRSSSAGSP